MNRLIGVELIRSLLDHVPESPAVYRMFGEEGNILYIGKAKNLKNRLSQYTLKQEGKNVIMVSLIYDIKYSVTESESAALILEGQLIKQYQPKFNILLKDDKSFPYIKLRTDHPYPQLLKYRGKVLGENNMFGPFASAQHVEVMLAEVQKIFRLRSCSDSYFSNRQRPCIQYQIKRCSAPCVNKISENNYNKNVSEVRDFLLGKSQNLQNILSKQMEEYSHNLQYEQAAEVRDKIKAISYVQLKSQNLFQLEDSDVIALANKNNVFCIELFIYRSYQSYGNQSYFPTHTKNKTASEVIEHFIIQHYQSHIPPKEIVISHDIANKHIYEMVLKELHHIAVKIMQPRLGNKKKVIDNAINNAVINLEKHLRISLNSTAILQEVKKLLDLDNIPQRIEIYDNSHIQGEFAVGAMVVAGIGGFDKKEYRLFNIKAERKNILGGDDYAMLREVLTRRLKRLRNEPQKRPDLIIIDGGKGHMKIVSDVMKKINVNISFVCMSKGIKRNSGEEIFHRPGRRPFTLDKNLGVMKYLQILRDEVHNFAIRSHRKKRSNAIRNSSLDPISGIGSKRKAFLLNYFGSFDAVATATIDELSKVSGINKKLAKLIYESLK